MSSAIKGTIPLLNKHKISLYCRLEKATEKFLTLPKVTIQGQKQELGSSCLSLVLDSMLVYKERSNAFYLEYNQSLS